MAEISDYGDSGELEELPGFATDDEAEFVEEMDEEEIKSYVGHLLDDAISYSDDELGQDRITSGKYYSGHIPEQDDEGRSGVVSYDVRDTVNSILPSMMRIFFGTKNILTFTPNGPEDVQMAEQCSDYINNLLMEQQPDFFNTMMSVFQDALIRRTGVMKYWWEEAESVKSSKFSGLDEQQAQMIAGEEDVESVDMEQSDQTPDGIPLFNVTVKRRIKKGKIRVEALPPEEFLIDRRAKSVMEADIVSHRSYKTISELTSLGYDPEMLEEHASADAAFGSNEEFISRHSDAPDRGRTHMEPAQRRVLYCESYINLDVDQDGISELRRICTIGNTHNVVDNGPCDYIPFVLFCPAPEPHTAIGASITDIVADIQRIKSAILRNVMDSLVMAVNPRMLVLENSVNLKDVLNTEVGSIIRARTPGAVTQLDMPFVGSAALPILGMLDEIKSTRTGITKASQGMDSENLQSATRLAVDSTVKAAQAHIELIARIFAESGLKPLYKGILQLIHKHQDREMMTRLRNQWIPIDPRYWDADMDVMVDIPLGAGNDMEKMQFLSTIAQKQETLLQQYGLENPIVNLGQYHTTLSRMVQLAGFKDPEAFFGDPAQYQPPPKEPEKPSPEEQYIQIQAQKAQADAQNDMGKLELDREKMIRLDDREKDRIESQAELSIMDMQAKYNTQMDGSKLKAMMDRDREEMKQNAALLQAQLAQQQQAEQQYQQQMLAQMQQPPQSLPNA